MEIEYFGVSALPITHYRNSVTNYDPAKIERFRLDGEGWREIAAYYSVKHPAVLNWYKRYQKREAIAFSEKIAFSADYTQKKRSAKPDKNHTSASSDTSNEGLGDYGTVDPTNFISTMNNDDWIEHYCGFNWKAPYLTEMRDSIWNTQKLLLLTFRFGGKTTTMSCLFVRWMLEVHEPIVCFGNAEKIGDIFYLITELLESDEIRRDYGDVVARKTGYKIWLVSDMRVSKDGSPMTDPNLSMSGKLATSVGKHTGDAGWLHLEDVWQEVKASADAEKRSRKWLDRTIRYMKGKNTKFTITGTRKDPDDAYQYAMDKLHFPVLRQQALVVKSGRLPTIDECEVDHVKEMITAYPEEVGEYIIQDCPRWELPYLLYEFLFHDTDAEAELNNNPLPSKGQYFDGEDWIEVESVPDTYSRYLIVDPAFGQSNSASKTAIILLAIGEGKMTIIDAYIGRLGLDEKAEMIVDFHYRHKPLQTLIEDNFRQITSRYSTDHPLMQLRGLSLIDQFESKRQRIEALKFPYRKRELQILASCPFKSELKAEYLTYNQTDADSTVRIKYNALDALSMGYLRFKHFISASPIKLKVGAIRRLR